MSFLSSTAGVVWRAFSGNVDPWTLQDVKAETREGIKKASAGQSPEVVAENQRRAEADIDGYLRQIDAHPDQSGLRIPGLGVVGSGEFLAKLGKIVNYALLAGVVIAGFYFASRFFRLARK